jgi:hypothetical protein
MPYDPIVDYANIQFDEQGRPFWVTQSGKRHYLAPLSAMQERSNPRAVEWARSMGVYETPEGEIVNKSAPGSSFLKERGHWDTEGGEWDQDTNWGNILATGVGAMIGGPFVAGALSGGSAPAASAAGSGAGAGVLPSAAIPGAHAAVPGIASTVGGGVPGAMGGAAGVAAGGGSILKDILSGVGDWAPTALAGANAVRQLTQGPPAAQQDLERILKLSEGRINQTEPLFQALNAMAQRGMPDYAKGGL